MKFEELTAVLKQEFPEEAINLAESLVLVKEIINDVMNAINHQMSKAYIDRNFDKSRAYMNMAEKFHQFEIKLEDIINELEVDNVDFMVPVENEEDDTTKNPVRNYSQYEVDSDVEHTLYENLTHIRPYGFKINEHQIVKVRTWKEMLVKACEFLIAIDEEKFLNFENVDYMNGKKNKYFSVDSRLLRKPENVANKIYVETNMSSNAIRNLLIKLLKEYNFKVKEFKVYFRADYTSLNSK
ncbi:hypothetical protein [Anoxybacillus sp. MB8]|uniref:hypothetical protein n=1 Tax=Anoxybacillus sp. MB8 TaxID=2496850 RepID=UPI0013D1FCC6|nr:hypothetical protein [Anoxybacillus sp. MB8]